MTIHNSQFTINPTVIFTCDPDFREMALAEWQTAAPNAAPPHSLAPGVYLAPLEGSSSYSEKALPGLGDRGIVPEVNIPSSPNPGEEKFSGHPYWSLAGQWLTAPPIFIRHIFPVVVTLPLSGAAVDVDELRQAARVEFSDLLDPDLPFSVQTRLFTDLPYKPFDVNNALAGVLQTGGVVLDVRAPQQVVSVVIANARAAAGQPKIPTAFLGLSPVQTNLSDWAGGVRRFARDKEQISRSEFKLLEALELFAITLPPRGRALDLGAAPGGWTRVLRQRGQYVTAVDPAALDPRLAEDSGVRHLQMTAESYLQQEPDQYDLIVNDMRLDARDSARLMAGYAPYLYRHGIALMTLKLPEHGREQIIHHAFNILRPAYAIAGARQLFHNRSEITLYLTK